MTDETISEKEAHVRAGFWPKMVAVAASLPFSEDLLAAWYCAFDRQTPNAVRITLIGALAYFVLPMDLVPDILPLLGYADDASVLSAALMTVGAHMQESHRQAARAALVRLTRG